MNLGKMASIGKIALKIPPVEEQANKLKDGVLSKLSEHVNIDDLKSKSEGLIENQLNNFDLPDYNNIASMMDVEPDMAEFTNLANMSGIDFL